MNIDEERMSDAMTKFHLRGPWPFHPVIHRFTDIDHGDPHDHPWGFRSFVLHGSYTEEVFTRLGARRTMVRNQGDSFVVPAHKIHRIIEISEGGCWTLILPGPPVQKSGFWQFRPDGIFQRRWDEAEWSRVSPGDCDV